MPMQSPANDAVATELESLPRCSIHDLRTRWRALFRREPPAAFGPDLLRRSIAQKLQEDVYGRMSPMAQRELNRIVALLEKSPSTRIELPRRIKAGAVLVRDWKGTAHRVIVAENGFSYEGRNYASLSEIAREITGTQWNGPRFFGLRPSGKPEEINSTGATGLRRGRPANQKVASNPSPTQGTGHGL